MICYGLSLCNWTELEATCMIRNTNICIVYTLFMNIHCKSTLAHFHLFLNLYVLKNHTYIDISNCSSEISFILYFPLLTYSLSYLINLALITTGLIKSLPLVCNWSPFAVPGPWHVQRFPVGHTSSCMLWLATLLWDTVFTLFRP